MTSTGSRTRPDAWIAMGPALKKVVRVLYIIIITRERERESVCVCVCVYNAHVWGDGQNILCALT